MNIQWFFNEFENLLGYAIRNNAHFSSRRSRIEVKDRSI